MRTRRPTVDFEELRRIANQVRIDTLNAVDELVIRTMSEGKDIDEVAIQIKRLLEVEMDQATERHVFKWFLH